MSKPTPTRKPNQPTTPLADAQCFFINLDMLDKFNFHRTLIAELLGGAA